MLSIKAIFRKAQFITIPSSEETRGSGRSRSGREVEVEVEVVVEVDETSVTSQLEMEGKQVNYNALKILGAVKNAQRDSTPCSGGPYFWISGYESELIL